MVQGVDKPPDRSGPVSYVLVVVAITAIFPIDPSGQMPNLALKAALSANTLQKLVLLSLSLFRRLGECCSPW